MGQLGEVIGLFYRFKFLPSPLTRVSRDLFILFSLVQRRRHLINKNFLRNVNLSYKRVTFPWFSELLLSLLILKNNQLKIILLPKRYILGWHFCSLALPTILIPSPECGSQVLSCL